MARFSFAPARSAGRAAAALPQHAIVLGGSMAGLITARVLAGHFDRVTIVERDQLPAGAVQRPGVPQARHAHILLTRGIRILEQLFPGLGDDLVAAGAARLSTTQEIGMLLVDRWAPAYPSPLYAYAASRNLLETLVRRRLRADSRVVFREGQEAAGLLAAPAGGRVTGFHLRGRGPAAGATEDLVADLVVDATGRTSHAPDWLEALGYGRPAETVVTAHAGYASRLYRFPTGPGQSIYGAWKGLATMPSAPHNPRAAVILPIEGDQWVVTLAGTNQAYAPTDEAGFLQFARSLPDPAIGELLARGEPLSPIAGYRRMENRWHHYERLPRWPAGFAVLGDATVAFNPVYAQGMTAAALAALVLDACLGTGRAPAGCTHQFQRRLAAHNRPLWVMATGADLAWPNSEGGQAGRMDRIMQRYLARVLQLSQTDAQVARCFQEVLHLVSSPTALFRPQVVGAVVRPAIRPQGGQGPAVQPRLPAWPAEG